MAHHGHLNEMAPRLQALCNTEEGARSENRSGVPYMDAFTLARDGRHCAALPYSQATIAAVTLAEDAVPRVDPDVPGKNLGARRLCLEIYWWYIWTVSTLSCSTSTRPGVTQARDSTTTQGASHRTRQACLGAATVAIKQPRAVAPRSVGWAR